MHQTHISFFFFFFILLIAHIFRSLQYSHRTAGDHKSHVHIHKHWVSFSGFSFVGLLEKHLFVSGEQRTMQIVTFLFCASRNIKHLTLIFCFCVLLLFLLLLYLLREWKYSSSFFAFLSSCVILALGELSSSFSLTLSQQRSIAYIWITCINIRAKRRRRVIFHAIHVSRFVAGLGDWSVCVE